MIPAIIKSDDGVFQAEFDALPWFEEATDEEIEELAVAGWTGYEADNVALAVSESNTEVAGVIVYGNEKVTNCTVQVNVGKALKYLQDNRPTLFARVCELNEG